MNKNKELDTRFEKAFETANKMDEVLIPIDLRLQFYAYYKQASHEAFPYRTNDPDAIRSAFKMNALLQVSKLTADEAKNAYIELVNTTIKRYHLNLEEI